MYPIIIHYFIEDVKFKHKLLCLARYCPFWSSTEFTLYFVTRYRVTGLYSKLEDKSFGSDAIRQIKFCLVKCMKVKLVDKFPLEN